MDDSAIGRRRFLGGLGGGVAGAAVLAACGADTALGRAEPRRCAAPTAPNIEGPFFRAGAPVRTSFVDGATSGTPLVIAGRVLDARCRPVRGASLEIWHADDEGEYDHRGFHLRGRIEADARGRYEIRSILPGHYLNGDTYRPAHVHVKVHVPGRPVLTTQLYFEGDPYNASDPFIRRSLIVRLRDAQGVRTGRFDFVV